ncbi:MAG: hypothetical protein IPJ37_17595 [Bacteroidales bacterium]|nr:hypothetical protein [Bacteroidales bacterium]
MIKSKRYTDNDENKILRSFNEKFKDLVDFDIYYVKIFLEQPEASISS